MQKALGGVVAAITLCVLGTGHAGASAVTADEYCSFGYKGTECNISIFYMPTFSPNEEITFNISCRGDNSSLVSISLVENSAPSLVSCSPELGTMDADYPTAGAYQQYVCKRKSATGGDVTASLRWNGTCKKF